MASIVTYRNGLKRIEFAFSPTDRRRVIRLGRVNQKNAEAFKAKVEAIIDDRLQGRHHDPEVSSWLGKLDETMLAKLRAVGLADGVGLARTTLGAFLNRWFKARTCKPQTSTFYGHTRRNLEAFFGEGRALSSVTAEDAERWRAWLVNDQGLSQATVSRRVKAARSMWKAAIRWKLASENPFADVRAGKQSNEARTVFIPQEVISQVMAHAPDTEWACIIALARYGGLRTPSETFLLRWQDIDWERGTIHITVPKLERFEGLDHRTIPLFPELRAHLLRLFAEAEDGAEYVIARLRQGCLNLRTQFIRILKRAGVAPWPRLFHNLRGSRETELMREYDLKTVCGWIGNSPEVAARHYATSVDLNADFRRAARLDDEGQQKGQQKGQRSASVPACGEVTTEAENGDKPPHDKGIDTPSRLVSCGSNEGYWAREDSNL